MRKSVTALASLLVLGLAAFAADARLGAAVAQDGASDGVVLEIIPGHYRYENGTRVAGVIVTDEGAVVLDGLSSPEMGEDVQAKVLAATGQPVRYLVNSTFHNNYTRGNAAYTDIVSIGGIVRLTGSDL